MTQTTPGRKGTATVATFHARVASVGLITTIVVLLAACGTFMLQQWAVARAQSHMIHLGQARIVAATTANGFATGEAHDIQSPLAALSQSASVVSARLLDADGKVIAQYRRAGGPVAEEVETIKTDVVDKGRKVGVFEMTVPEPSLGPMLPKFIALTAALLFGGVGVALFLARSLAGRVVAPVQRLSEAMHEVAAGGSFEPVEVKAQDGLFRSLNNSFNHLLGKLGEREEDLKAAMRELEAARDAADAANVLKTHFLANMSHEIRTPLNGVLAMAEVMSRDELGPVQRDRLAVIRQSGDLLLAVLNDVLDLSKIEAGKLALLVDDFDLDAAVAAARESFAVMARNKGLDFSLQVSPEASGWWRGDADRLRQIFGNLLSNAIKFTTYGAVEAVIDIAPDTGCLRLVVRDTGVGITPEKLPTLFEKFIQADNSATRRFGGTGLGLAICRELTKMMGGSIGVESREGYGSAFTVQLPLPRGEPVAVADQDPIVRPDEDNLRLLAAEDNATNQQVLAAVMGSLGIDIDIVADGQQAIDAWRDGVYDLILMDIQMPVMDGMAAARAIRDVERREPNRRRIPIVALTANALVHQVEEYLAAGMDGHVAKPIEIAKLYDAISTALNAAATGSAGAQAHPPAQVA